MYFCLKLCDSEHVVVESQLREICELYGAKILYYRKLDPEVEMTREVEIDGKGIDRVREFIDNMGIWQFFVPHPNERNLNA